MAIISTPYESIDEDLFVNLNSMLGLDLYLKCEGLNFAGSAKLKAAVEMVAALEECGTIGIDSILVESTSGNMGIALSMIAASKGLPFVCVTDPRCNNGARRLIRALGADLRVVTDPDPSGGYLGSRIAYIRRLCADDPRYVWINQYTNPGNWKAHYRRTGPAIARSFPQLDVLFIGTGTAGTLMGCARYFRNRPKPPAVVAIDTVGSVTFGGIPGPRTIPGLGSSIPSHHLDIRCIDDVVHVAEGDAVRVCRRLATHGFLFGGSTGTVISGALRWLASHDPSGQLTAVAIAPDLGERYLESVYDNDWVLDHLGPSALDLNRRLSGGAESSVIPTLIEG